MTKKTFSHRLRKFYDNPSDFGIRILQGGIDYLRNYSYDFEKNGERNLLETFKSEKTNVIFDVGANIGDWSKIARELFPKTQIHSFELSPTTYNNLLNKLYGLEIFVNNFGLGDLDATIDFKDYGADSKVNTIILDAKYHDHKIQPKISKARIAKGDTYCLEKKIDFIDILKIDVEGAENLVLKGFSEMLKNKKVRLIQFEYGYTNGDSHFLMRDFYEFFNSFGYKVGKLSKKGVIFNSWNYKLNDFRSGPNYIAIQEDDKILSDKLSKFRT